MAHWWEPRWNDQTIELGVGIFHCPRCFADRRYDICVVPDDRDPSYNRQVARCLACGEEVRVCAVDHSPTSDHFPTRMLTATRAIASALLAAGRDAHDAEARRVATDFVEILSGMDLDDDGLDDDLRAPDGEIRLVGELQLVTPLLLHESRHEVLRWAILTATATGPMTDEQGSIVRKIASSLGVDWAVVCELATVLGTELPLGYEAVPIPRAKQPGRLSRLFRRS